MPSELEAFVGHLFVVGGRAVSVPPPGALAETPPKRAPRIREGDRLFMLVTPTDDTRAPASFYTDLARLGADIYFGSSGGITGGLREAFASMHRSLKAEARQVNAVLLVQRGEEVFAARSGRAFGLLRQGETLIPFPADRNDPLEVHAPLGSGEEPDIQFGHYTVAAGQMILLADAGLSSTNDEALGEALNHSDMRPVLDRLKELAGQQTSASVIQFLAPGTPDPDHLAPQASERLPQHAGPQPAGPRQTAEPQPAPQEHAPRFMTARTSKPRLSSDAPPPVLEIEEESPADSGETPAVERARATLERVSTLTSKVVERSPSVFERVRLGIQRTLRTIVRTLLAAILGVTNGLQSGLNKILPAPGENGKQGIPTNMAVAMAILIPVVIVILVVGLAMTHQGQTDFEQDLARAQAAYDEALRVSGDNYQDPALRATWQEVLRLANIAYNQRPGDETVQRIRADAQNYLDYYDDIVRRNLKVLHEFPEGAELVGPILHSNGVDLYTLDRKNDVIYHDTLNERGDDLTSSNDQPIHRGQAIGVYTVGDLIDIEWLPNGGTVHSNVLIALDRDGLLISYSSTFFENAQALVTEGLWQNPVALAVFEDNVYVLDSGANQIWKYVPTAGEASYSTAPEEYFTGEERPDLSHAVDFGISADEGAVYILFDDGSVQRYRRNIQGVVVQQPFEYSDRPGGSLVNGTALFVDNDPASRNLYILDGVNETVYETSFAGTYRNGYRPRNASHAFRGLSGLYADTVARNNMYVLAGNKLYTFSRG